MRKKYLLLGAAALLVSAAVVSGSLAAISAVGDRATNELGAPTLSVSIGSYVEPTQTRVGDDTQGIMPGDHLSCDGFVVKNTADVPLYARVTVTKYWTDEKNTKNQDLDANLIQMNVDETGWLQANEVFSGNSGETEVYYLAKPLASGESATLNLGILISSELSNAAQNAGISVSAQVDAVQYVAGENELNANGILASFGVEAELNGDGSIASVTQ